MECRKLSLTEEINILSELRKYLKDNSVAGKRNHSRNLYLDVDNNCLNQAVVFLSAHLVGKWTLNNPEYNSEDGTDNYEPTEETVRDINDILELFASRYAVNILYSIEQNKTMLFYISEEQQEQNTNAYVIQIKGIKSDKWQNYKAFDSYLKAKFIDIKELLKANFFTWLCGISNYELRIVKYERTTDNRNSEKIDRGSCEQPYQFLYYKHTIYKL